MDEMIEDLQTTRLLPQGNPVIPAPSSAGRPAPFASRSAAAIGRTVAYAKHRDAKMMFEDTTRVARENPAAAWAAQPLSAFCLVF
jgi:hypothetical protein